MIEIQVLDYNEFQPSFSQEIFAMEAIREKGYMAGALKVYMSIYAYVIKCNESSTINRVSFL